MSHGFVEPEIVQGNKVEPMAKQDTPFFPNCNVQDFKHVARNSPSTKL